MHMTHTCYVGGTSVLIYHAGLRNKHEQDIGSTAQYIDNSIVEETNIKIKKLDPHLIGA